MEYKLVKLSRFSGEKASIYSVQTKNTNDEFQDTLFDEFVKENKNSLLSELKDLFTRLKTIGNNTGARESFSRLMKVCQETGCVLYMTIQKKDLDSIALDTERTLLSLEVEALKMYKNYKMIKS